MKKIVLTGGGTAGHVTPNIALIPALKDAGYDISYIGSYDGIEKKLIQGDVNGDGKVTASDARQALRAASQLETLSEKETVAADMNDDGKVTAADARAILNEASGVKT